MVILYVQFKIKLLKAIGFIKLGNISFISPCFRETLLQAMRGCIRNGGTKIGDKIKTEVSRASLVSDDLVQLLVSS